MSPRWVPLKFLPSKGFATCVLALLLAVGTGCGTNISETQVDISEDIVPDDTPAPGDGMEADGADGADGITPIPLSIHSITPAVGTSAGGDIVTLLGTGFTTDSRVFFDESEGLLPYVESDELLVVQTPSHPVGKVDVTIKLSDGQETTVIDGFAFRTQASVDSIVPASGPISGGTAVELHGKGFTADSTLLFGGASAIEIEIVDAETILAITPEGEAGYVDVQVTADGGFSALYKGFEYKAEPRIDLLQPWSGSMAGETGVMIFGEGLREDAVATFGANEAITLETGNGTSLLVSTPPGPEGPVDVGITTSEGSFVLSAGYTYLGASSEFTLLNAVPSHGTQAGGTLVYLTATGLDESPMTILFGNAPASVIQTAPFDNLVAVSTPASDTLGPVDISITQNGKTSFLSTAFSYGPVLELTSVSPPEGPIEGGTPITLHGKGFEADMEVTIGPLPVTNLVWVDNTQLEAITPPGSMGGSTVRVQRGDTITKLVGGFTYSPPMGLGLLAISPHEGAMAGGTYVEIYGYGFTSGTQVWFGTAEAQEVLVYSATRLGAYTPAWYVDTVDVRVLAGMQEATLGAAYTYFNPTNSFGGTWGGPIDGALNVSVLQVPDGTPVDNATVILVSPEGTWVKETDENGQVTFSGPVLTGSVEVSASKPGYTASSVFDYDAENVSVYLFPPPNMGPPVPIGPVEPGQLHGKVHGMDKYILVPPTDCDHLTENDPVACHPCEVDADCGEEGAICAVLAQPENTEESRCTFVCANNDDCPDGYVCGVSQDAQVVCHPAPADKAAYCKTTKNDIVFNQSPVQPHNWVDDNRYYLIPASPISLPTLTEIAVICYGGFQSEFTAFVPTVMGVRRHVHPINGEILDGQDVQLDIPLTRQLIARLDRPPASDTDLFPPAFGIHLQLDGEDGYIEMPNIPVTTEEGALAFDGYPQALSGPLFGASYVLNTTIVEVGPESRASFNLLQNIDNLDGEPFLHKEDGDSNWSSMNTDIEEHLHDLWGDAFRVAVGKDGVIVHEGQTGWTVQNSPTYDDLNGVWGTSSSDIWAVGNNGTIVHFNAILWSAHDTPCTGDLLDLWGSGAEDVYAVGADGICHFDGAAWQQLDVAHAHALTGIHGIGPNHIMATGDNGKVLFYDGTGWTALLVAEGTTLRDIHLFAPEHAIAVGDGGSVLEWDGTNWQPISFPKTTSLHAVNGISSADFWVGGNGTTLAHWDGANWSDTSTPEVGVDVRAIWPGQSPDQPTIAIGIHRLLIGPFMPFPEVVQPGFGGLLFDEIAWNPPLETYVDFTKIVLFNSMGIPLWQMLVNGEENQVDLPDFEAFMGSVLTPGGIMISIAHVQWLDSSPFDIDSFIELDLFDTFRRLTWSLSLVEVFH